VHDAAPGGEPLRVAAAEARRAPERVGVVDEPAPYVGDGLEAAVRVLREAGHLEPVVHAPAVDPGEVGSELVTGEGHGRPELLVPRRVRVVVVDAEEKGIDRGPRAPGEGHDLGHHGVGYGPTVRARDYCPIR
jgi:hypothetical protein